MGDGSGSRWGRPAGWACACVERVTAVTKDPQVFFGAINSGTVNFAEMMAYAQPLDWLAWREVELREKGGPTRVLRVHVVTDSDYCRSTGASGRASTSRKNPGLWQVFGVYARFGLVLTWHHLPREEHALNRYCDRLSKLARKRTAAYNYAADIGKPFGGPG